VEWDEKKETTADPLLGMTSKKSNSNDKGDCNGSGSMSIVMSIV
jgi:hypothetical protein